LSLPVPSLIPSVRLSRLLCVVIACAVLVPAAGAAAKPPPRWFGPPSEYCGSFKSGYTIHVGAHKMSCRLALRIQKEYWNGKRRDRVEHRGESLAESWTLLKKFPGWRCAAGSGGGGCAKGAARAYYQN
jgi:hypothetical protein